MKILYLSTGCFDKGGISRYNRYQITALREILGPSNVKAFSLLGQASDDFEEKFEVDWISGGNGLLHKLKFGYKVLLTSLSWKPDLILCAHVNLSGLAFLATFFSPAKLVLNVYGLEVWSKLTKDASWGLKKSHYIISDCHFTANYLTENDIKDPKTIRVIWDCVDLNKFVPRKVRPEILEKYNIPDPKKFFNILTLGRLSSAARHKGYERLIEVFKLVAAHSENARLVIAGKGDFKGQLEALVKKEDLDGKVVFTGMVAEEDMPAVYSTADVFSLVSDRGEGRGEGIPLTPLEAMACGVPIVVGNHDGSQEAVFGEKNGYIIDPFDLETHKKIFLDLINDQQLLLEKKKNTTEIAEKYFSYQGFVDKHKSLLKALHFELDGK